MAILIIDDEPMLRETLATYLEDMDYDIFEAGNGREGLEQLQANMDEVEAVIVDLNMPVMDGYGFIREAVPMNEELPIIVLSGVGIVEDALQAIRLGAWDFITKPITNFSILDYTLTKAFEKTRLIKENKEYQAGLERLVEKRTKQVENTRYQIMQRLSRAAEFKDNETGRHVIRVGKLCALLGQQLGLGEERSKMLRECAALHDLGKIGIPDHILLKPGKLTPDEWKIMQRHCTIGCEILGPLEDAVKARKACEVLPTLDKMKECKLICLARTLALLHHERWNGTGYPFGLSGDDIPIEARVVAIVDVFDALSSERPYKPAFPLEKTLGILRSESGKHFDPAVVEVFFDNLEAITDIVDAWKD